MLDQSPSYLEAEAETSTASTEGQEPEVKSRERLLMAAPFYMANISVFVFGIVL